MSQKRPIATKTVFISSDASTTPSPLKKLLKQSKFSSEELAIEAELEAKAIPGNLSLKEGALLYRLAQRYRSEGVMIAVGALEGRATYWLARGSNRQASLQIVACTGDTSTNSETRYRSNLKKLGVDSRVQVCTRESFLSDEQPKAIDLLFIEGGTDRQAIKKDIEFWFPRLRIGGMIAFHDSIKRNNPEVHHVACETIFGQPCFHKVRFAQSITYATKVQRTTAREKLAKKGVKALLALRN